MTAAAGSGSAPRVMIVTGGGRGIGAATARLAARKGYAVCVNYLRDRSAAEAVVHEIPVLRAARLRSPAMSPRKTTS